MRCAATVSRAYGAANDAGLDSTNAANIVDILAELAHGGVNVILTIHQPRPDVFRLMDIVLLMSGNGQVYALPRLNTKSQPYQYLQSNGGPNNPDPSLILSCSLIHTPRIYGPDINQHVHPQLVQCAVRSAAPLCCVT